MSSILSGADEIVDEIFQIKNIGKPAPRYHYRTCWKRLSEKPPAGPKGKRLLQKMYRRIVRNWKNSQSKSPRTASTQNWRFEKVLDISKKSASLEVKLERATVRLTDESWVNQVPTSSGLAGPRADKRRAIDLVRRFGKKKYEFIELKIDSDTPLYAAIEIVTYGLLYLFSRNYFGPLGYREINSEILEANSIHLKALAPKNFYGKFDLRWLEEIINDKLSMPLNSDQPPQIKMDFRFEILPISVISKKASWGSAEILESLASRSPAYVWPASKTPAGSSLEATWSLLFKKTAHEKPHQAGG